MGILITGASGFFGQHLIHHFKDKELIHAVSRRKLVNELITDKQHTLDCMDLSIPSNVINMFKSRTNIHTIYHFAGQANPRLDPINPTNIIDTNVKITHNLLEFCPAGVNFVFASSVVVYREPQEVTIVTCDESAPTEPKSVYGMTKLASEHLIDVYLKQGKINKAYILRLCATVGAGLTHGVVYDFIRKLQGPKKNLEAWGNYPGTDKPYCHISDVISALQFLKGMSFTANVCPRNSITTAALAHAVMDGLEIEKPIRWLGDASNNPGDNKRLVPQSVVLSSKGWQPQYHSYDAIVKAVREIKNGS